MIDSSARWKTAIHEAGHAVSAIALGGRCDGLAIFPDGGGLAQTDEVLGDREAFMISAGPASESLAGQYPCPDVESVKTGTLTVDEIEALPLVATAARLACQLARASDDRRPVATDAQRLAQWAISDCEDSPESWARRVAFAHRIAADIVTKNAAAIVRIATALYERGSLGRDEITELFEEPK